MWEKDTGFHVSVNMTIFLQIITEWNKRGELKMWQKFVSDHALCRPFRVAIPQGWRYPGRSLCVVGPPKVEHWIYGWDHHSMVMASHDYIVEDETNIEWKKIKNHTIFFNSCKEFLQKFRPWDSAPYDCESGRELRWDTLLKFFLFAWVSDVILWAGSVFKIQWNRRSLTTGKGCLCHAGLQMVYDNGETDGVR